ncbi:MAG: TolC family protein [Candidatus Acidiferrum sp.]
MKPQVRLLAVLSATAISATLSLAQTQQNLNLQQAEQIAVQNHPRIQAAMNLASAAKAQVTQTRSAYYPTVYGSLTGVDAENNSRIAAGALNNPIIYDRYANGVTVSQLITDFGRTHELVKSSDLNAQAQQANVVTSRADVLLQVDQAYFFALKAQSVLAVAEETVKERQLASDQVTELAKNKIKSELDVNFANVNLAQAQLLLIQAQNDLQSSFARLSAALGYSDLRTFTLAEQPMPSAPPADLASLVQQALRDRPELISQRLAVSSAQSYATAERDLKLPTISALGTAGLTPVNENPLAPRYAAGGFNVNIPIFNGHLYGALHTEAASRAQAEIQVLRDLQDQIVREVQTAWLNTNSAYQRLSVTQRLLSEANQAFDLAQGRYTLGLSSIIELTQAELNQTEARIEQASATYDYEAQYSLLNYQLGALR